MKNLFEKIHSHLEEIKEPLYKGTQLYFSPLMPSEILFIGINPGIGYFKYHNKNVKRLNPLEKFEYNGQKYVLATQTKKIFNDLGLSQSFSNAIKINQFPFATRNEKDLILLLEKYDADLKLYYVSKQFLIETISFVKPKLIICEGKSSFDRLKKVLNSTPIEYNENTYVLKNNEFVAIGYKRHLSYIKDKEEFKEKINKYYIIEK